MVPPPHAAVAQLRPAPVARPTSPRLHPCRAQVFGYALYKNGEFACVKYPMEGYAHDVAGRSFHHGRFVQRLRQAAASSPGVTVREGPGRRLLNGGRAWRLLRAGRGELRVPPMQRHHLH